MCYDHLVNSVSGLFPEEQKKLNITREEIRQTVLHSVTKARDYLFELDPTIRKEKLDVKFSIIIEKPTEETVLFIDCINSIAHSHFDSHSAHDEVSFSPNHL